MKQGGVLSGIRNTKLNEAVQLLLSAPDGEKVDSLPAKRLQKVNSRSLSAVTEITMETLFDACERILCFYEEERARLVDSRLSSDVRGAFEDIQKLSRQLSIKLAALSDDEYRTLLGAGLSDSSEDFSRMNELIEEVGWEELSPSYWRRPGEGKRRTLSTALGRKLETFSEIARLASEFMKSYTRTRPKTFVAAISVRPDRRLVAMAGDLFVQLNLSIVSTRGGRFDRFLCCMKEAAGISNEAARSFDNAIKDYLAQREASIITFHRLQRYLRNTEFSADEHIATFLDLIARGERDGLEGRFGVPTVEAAISLIKQLNDLNGE